MEPQLCSILAFHRSHSHLALQLPVCPCFGGHLDCSISGVEFRAMRKIRGTSGIHDTFRLIVKQGAAEDWF